MVDKIDDEQEKKMSITSIIFNIIYFISGIYAFYLSWSCNKESSFIMKVIYSGFASGFGILYIIYYYMFKASKCLN